MRSVIEYAAMCAILASTGLTARAQHIHDRHPESPHDGDWVRISLTDGSAESAEPDVEVVPETTKVIYARTVKNGLCDPVIRTLTHTTSTTDSVAVNWDVGTTGTATWAAGALFASLEAEVGIDVERGQTWEGTNTEIWQINDEVPIPPCEKVSFTATVVERTATGTVTSGDHVIVCQCTGCGQTETNYCNKVVLSGTAEGYSEYVDAYDPAGPYGDCSECEGSGEDN